MWTIRETYPKSDPKAIAVKNQSLYHWLAKRIESKPVKH